MARPSAIYNNRKSQPMNGTRNKYKFPVLDVKELITLLDALDFDVNEEMLEKPSTLFMKSLVDQIMDKFLYISPYSLRQKVQQIETNEDMPDDNIQNSLNIVASQRIMYKFLCDCGVDDYSIKDVAKPEASRVRTILSALINYARFREERMGDCDHLLESSDGIINTYKEILKKNNDLRDQLAALTEQLNSQGIDINEVNAKQARLENELKRLRSVQHELSSEHEQYKTEKKDLVDELGNLSSVQVTVEKDLEEIKPLVQETPESVNEMIEKLQQQMLSEQQRLKNLESKSKDMIVSNDSLNLLINEFRNLLKIVEDLQNEANKQAQSNDRLKNLQEQINESKISIKSYSMQKSAIEKQLKRNQEKIQKETKFYEDKLASLNEKLEIQSADAAELQAKSNIENIDLTSKESQISQWEKQMADLQKNFDHECKEAGFEMEKFNSQIQLYITEMSKKIDEQDI